MPIMDGYTATEQIRIIEKEESLKPTPIIAVTAQALRQDLDRALESGCDAYLTKPVRYDLLLSYVKKHIED